MFAKLKKKIEEAEGSDLQKLASSITSSMSSQIEKKLSLSSVKSTENLASQSTFSRGSTASLASLNTTTSPDHVVDDQRRSDSEVQALLKEKEEQWKSKLAEVEKSWKAKVTALQQEKDEFHKERTTHRIILEEKNKELAGLKETFSKLQQDLEDLRDQQKQRLKAFELRESELHKTMGLKEELMKEKDNEIQLLQEKLTAATQNPESQSSQGSKFNKLENDHGTLLLRNAELSQQVSVKQQELQRTEQQFYQTSEELTLIKKENLLLQTELAEKNQALKLLQQRVNDMKKTLQKEMKSGSAAATANGAPEDQPRSVEDVNVSYLKHVIFKFLTSREYEAKHLTRAVATLLKFTPDEEKLLKDTLEWKMSWFGNRPNLGEGQNALYIPPFQ